MAPFPGAPQVIDLEEEGDLVLALTSMGELEPPATEEGSDPTLTSMGEPVPPARLGGLAITFEEPSSSKSNEEFFWCPFDMEGRALKILSDLESASLGLQEPQDVEDCGLVELMLREFLLHVWEELYDLEKQTCSIDGCSSEAEYRYHVLRMFLPLTVGDRWLGNQFGVSPMMGVDEHQKIIRAGKCPEEVGVAQVSKEFLCPEPLPSVWECLATSLSMNLSKARSRAEDELEAMLERRYAEAWQRGSGASSMSSRRWDRGLIDLFAAQLEQEHQNEDTAELLSDLAAVRAERDEAINGAEAAKEEASGLSIELVVVRSEAEALRTWDVDYDVNGGQVALLGSRDAEPFSQFEVK
ncbi:hypothetical protein ACLOJK_014670 [Asimina triloba]